MRKIILLWTAALCLLTGCSDMRSFPELTNAEEVQEAEIPAEPVPVEQLEEIPEETVTETVSDPMQERIRSYRSAEDGCIFDECGVLSEELREKYDSYLRELSEQRLLCTALVITEHLDGATPIGLAEAYYKALYSEGTSGFVVLLNNETGKDAVYCHGVCATDLRNPQIAVLRATPYLITGDYDSALQILLVEQGEQILSCVFDRVNAIKPNERQTLQAKADASGHAYAVYMTDGVPAAGKGQSYEKILSDWAEEKRIQTGTELLLVMDVKQQQCCIAGDDRAEIAAQVQALWKQKNIFDAAVLYYDSLEN